jgi:molecular chaperone GrpE
MSKHASHEHGSHKETHSPASEEKKSSVDQEKGQGNPLPEPETGGPGPEETQKAENAGSGPDSVDTDDSREAAKTPEEQAAALRMALAELNDQYLRKAADFENFRKRMNREKQEAIEFANQGLLQDLIPVIDDFERALKSAESSRDFDSFYEGIGMIEKRLISQLENRWGLARFDSAGKPFDPLLHEAIMVEKSAQVTEPVVAEDFLKGFMLKDRVIRSAKVKVLMPEEAGNPGGQEEIQESGEAPSA